MYVELIHDDNGLKSFTFIITLVEASQQRRI